MIKLDIQEYCQCCPYFRATSETLTIYTNELENAVIGETVITCEDKYKCNLIHSHLRNLCKDGKH